jgi:phosphatidylglycerophosphatase A
MSRLGITIASIGGLGRFPFPGIAGSFVGLLAGYLLREVPVMPRFIFIAFLTTGLILYLAHSAREEMATDSKQVIVDEACGFLVVLLFMPWNLVKALIALVIFRVLDNVKLFPANRIEHLSNKTLAVFLDDLVVGVYTGLIMLAFTRL